MSLSAHVSQGDGTDVSAFQNPDGSLGARFDAVGRRRCGTTTAPVVAVNTSGAGAGSSAVLTSGTDEHGLVTVTTAGTPAAGTLATVTFNTAYAATPTVVISSGDVDSAAAQLYATVSTTVLTIKYAGTVAASKNLKINYRVVGGA